MTNIVVPELGESVVEARVARWLKKEGDRVEVGEAIVELETEKIDLEVNAEKGGVIASIKRQEGEDVKIGELLAIVDESGAARPAAGGNGAAAAAASPEPAAAPAGAPASTPRAARAEQSSAEPPKATPTARRIAQEHDVNLGAVQGSGSAGRVMKQDVQNVITKPGSGAEASVPAPTPPPAQAPASARPAAPVPAVQAPAPRPAGERAERRVRMTKRRATIARRLVEAQHTAAMLTTFNEIDMSAVMSLRERRKEAFKKQYGFNLGIASFFVKASIAALRAFPPLNAEIQGDEIVYKESL